MGVFMPMTYFWKILNGICESKIAIGNSGKGSRPNVYSLGLIIPFVGLPKKLILFLPVLSSFPIGEW